jgi:hypothetical protein
MPNLTTIAKWAESLGISRQQGYTALERCEIPVTDGKVDAEYATMLYHRNTRPRANSRRDQAETSAPGNLGSAPQPDNTPSYEKSRARREAAEAAQAEMKAADMAGLYLVKEDVDAVAYEVARAIRDGLTNCARRVASDVAGRSSAEECEEIIDREHRALLENMALTFKARLGVVGGSDSQ